MLRAQVFSASGGVVARPTPASPTKSPGVAHPRWLPGRGARVTTLIIAILLASLADLALTLTFLTSVGMSEANPIARAVIGTGSAWVVVGFKVALSVGACGIFFVARRRASGEIGAWLGALLMCWLIVRWHTYIDHSHHFTGVLAGQQHATDERWVALGE